MKIAPITPRFGAVVSDIDLSQPLDRTTIDDIERVFTTYGVVVFPGQRLDNDSQAAFGRSFGELEISPKRYRSENKHRIESAAIIDVSNLDENNVPRKREERRRLETMSNMLWHTDTSFRQIPGRYSMLYAHAVPPWGGETEFADTRSGYEAVPADLKEIIADLRAVHVYGAHRTKLGYPSFSEEEAKALPKVEHPVVRYHEESGRKALYLGSHTSHILGWPIPEGAILLSELLEITTRREFVYSHGWTVGDLVVWDNRTTLHRGRRFDERYPRDMRRVTTRDLPRQEAGALQQEAV